MEVDLMREAGTIVGADLLSPQPLAQLAQADTQAAAACLGLVVDDIRTEAHGPCVVSVGLPFLVIEVASREALGRARPDRRAYDNLFPLDGARSVYAYWRDPAGGGAPGGCDLHARMFTWRLFEDPATGSATAAVTALLADLTGTDLRLRTRQGEDMGRSSLLLTRTVCGGSGIRARVGGRCAAMFSGTFDLP